GAAAASGRAVMGWFGRAERGFALGIRQMAVPLGGAAGALSLPLAVRAGGLDAAMLVLAAGCAAGAVAAGAWIREPSAEVAAEDRTAPGAPPPLRDRRVWRLSVGSALIVCAQTATLSFAVLFLHDHRGVGAAAAAAVLAAIQLGGGLARLVAGRLSDRRGRRVAPLRRLAAGTAVALLGVAGLTEAPLAVLIPALVGTGILAMSWNGLSMTAAAELAGLAQAGTAIGLQGTVMRIPQAGIGVAFGAVVASSSWALAFALLAALPLAGWALIAPLEPEEERRLAISTQSRHERAVTA
ncbi:MAG TPA: MFS transporter, partial [Solirubrobacteraceae bacterium]